MAMNLRIWKRAQLTKWQPNVWDLLAIIIVFSLFGILAWGAKQMAAPYQLGKPIVISLAISHLPQYAFRTFLRLVIALSISLLFTLTVGYVAAKNKHAERLIIPIIDVLQSVPILGFLSITVVVFISLFPNRLLGPECAALFAIFTSQAWNMCLGFYQSLKMVPHHLVEASRMFHLSAWQKFWRVEVPFAIPSLIWNMMMSLSGSWFFLTLSEAITVNHQKIMLPGIGSYIAMAIEHANKHAIACAIFTMFVVILLYDQVLFRPLIAWSDKFKAEETAQEHKPRALLSTIMRRTRLLSKIQGGLHTVGDFLINFPRFFKRPKTIYVYRPPSSLSKTLLTIWYGTISVACAVMFFSLAHYILRFISVDEVSKVVVLGVYTSLRIVVLITICSFIWVPVGVWVGLRPRVAEIIQPIAQFLAAFPANVVFPIIVMLIIKHHLNVQIWTTPLMILGTQWYILFNVIAGTSALPKDLIQVAQNLGVRNWLWWRRFALPGIFPYFITGAITAAGGAWNASIVAEVVQWGSTTLRASGLGAYIAQVTADGDFPRIALGISTMCLFVLTFNRLVWRPLYHIAEKRFQLD